MTDIDDVDEPQLRVWADKFFALCADSGRFRLVQLREYVGQMLRVRLNAWHAERLQTYVTERGGRSCDKAVPDLIQMPKKRVRGLPKGKKALGTVDMFDAPKPEKEAPRGRSKLAR